MDAVRRYSSNGKVDSFYFALLFLINNIQYTSFPFKFYILHFLFRTNLLFHSFVNSRFYCNAFENRNSNISISTPATFNVMRFVTGTRYTRSFFLSPPWRELLYRWTISFFLRRVSRDEFTETEINWLWWLRDGRKFSSIPCVQRAKY